MFLSHAWRMTGRLLQGKTHVTSAAPVSSSLSIASIVLSPFHPSLPSSSVLPELSHGSSQFICPGLLVLEGFLVFSSAEPAAPQGQTSRRKSKTPFAAKVPFPHHGLFSPLKSDHLQIEASERRIERL